MVKRMRLIARLWSGIIAAICLFILFGYIGNFFASGQPDPYAVGNYPPIENIPPFFNLLSAFLLVIAWKWEYLGGIVTILIQLCLIPVYLIHWPLTENILYLIVPYGLSLFFIIPAVLFILCGRHSKRQLR